LLKFDGRTSYLFVKDFRYRLNHAHPAHLAAIYLILSQNRIAQKQERWRNLYSFQRYRQVQQKQADSTFVGSATPPVIPEHAAGNFYGMVCLTALTIRTENHSEGKEMAVVRKALISQLHDRWTVKVRNGSDLDVQGNILDHEYSIKQGRHKIAEVSRRWFRITHTYGVEMEEGQNDILILAIAVAMDAMAHQRR
jgi:hypothetical protein